MNNNTTARQQRVTRIRNKVRGTKDRPRLSVYRSNTSTYAQIIDDTIGKTLLGVSGKTLQQASGTKTEKGKALGIALAEKAKKQKITKVVFDKGAYKYHGRIKAVADGAREGGLEF